MLACGEHIFPSPEVIFIKNYVTQDAAEQLAGRLSARDQAILRDLARVRVLTGDQLSRLHFHDLSPGSQDRTRRRVMARLSEHQLTATLDRTIGGVRSGSAGHTYSLGLAGKRVLPLLGPDIHIDRSAPSSSRSTWVGDEMGKSAKPDGRPRTPTTSGTLFLAHSLAIAELYVVLRQHERAHDLTLTSFAAEPATWYPDGRGGLLKPDAYTRIQHGDIEDCWWIEVDRATESIPTLKRKLLAYVDFARAGQLGPDGIMPRVLVTVPHDHRLTAVRDLVEALPDPAQQLILPTLHDQAAGTMINILRS